MIHIFLIPSRPGLLKDWPLYIVELCVIIEPFSARFQSTIYRQFNLYIQDLLDRESLPVLFSHRTLNCSSTSMWCFSSRDSKTLNDCIYFKRNFSAYKNSMFSWSTSVLSLSFILSFCQRFYLLFQGSLVCTDITSLSITSLICRAYWYIYTCMIFANF